MMFRRKASPRQETRGRERRSQSSSALQQNGHKRQDSDGEIEVKNTSYGDPDIIANQSSRARAVTSPTTELPFQGKQLNPAGGRTEDVESAVYVTPADTLSRSASHSAVPSAISGSSTGSASNTTGSGIPGENFSGSRSERRNMQLHQLTMSQVSKRQQSGGTIGAEVTGPGTAVPVVGQDQQRIQMGESSDYSIPFNLLQAGDSTKPPRSHHHHRRMVPQAILPDNSECIIPINPPSTSPQSPSDRSDTTSPNSPRSNQSSEHELQQQQQPPPSRPPDDGDYAIPWDRSRIFQNIPRSSVNSNRRHPVRRRNEELDDLSSGPSRSRGGSLRDQSSPPLPPATGGYRYQSGGGGEVAIQVPPPPPPPPPPEDSPPPPELPYDPNRPWRGRAVSDRMNDGTSMSAGGWGHNRATMAAAEDFGSRSQSMSSHVRSGRRLPTPPGGGGSGGDWPPKDAAPPPPPPQVWRQSNPATIDPSIPLEDQP